MNNLTVETPAIHAAHSLKEIEEIQRFRYHVYAQEMGLDLPGVDHVRKVLVDSLDSSATHLYLRAGPQLVGAVRLNLNKVPRGLEAALQTLGQSRPFVYCSRLFVLEEWRGQGAVGQLAKACFKYFLETKAAVAICHCYPRLTKLYANLGFHAYGAPFAVSGLEHLGKQQPLRCILNKQQSHSLAA